MNFTVTQKFDRLISDIHNCKKWINEGTNIAMKELKQARIMYMKLKSKYDKASKDVEASQQAFEKAKNEPGNGYQLGFVQKFKDRLRSSTKDLRSIQSSLEAQAELITDKHESLENTLYTTHSSVLDLEVDSLHILLSNYYAYLGIIKTMLNFRREQVLNRFTNLEDSHDLSLDINSSNEFDVFLFDGSKEKLETRLSISDERTKIIKAFKDYINETMSAEEDLGKSVENILMSFRIPEYMQNKSIGKSHWEAFSNALIDISKIYQLFARQISKMIIEPLSGVTKAQENLKKSLQASYLKFVETNPIEKNHKGNLSSRSTNGSPNLKESYSLRLSFVEQVVNLFSVSNEEEKINLENITLIFEDMHKLDEDLFNSIDEVIEKVENRLNSLALEGEYKDVSLYEKKEINDESFRAIRELSRGNTVDTEEIEFDDIEAEDSVLAKFDLSPNTQIVDSFTCALSQKILLHGRMYLTTTHVCFHSCFNSSTLFGRETLVAIPLTEITKVDKKQIALIFDSAMSISTSSSEFLFTSFLFRDQA